MRTCLAFALTVLGLAPSVADAADARPAKPEMRVNVPPYALDTKVFDFPTGLRIMMQSDRSHPVVTVYTMVDHGSADDPEGKEETAHFCEHLWFRSKHGDLPAIWEVIPNMGAAFNATTSNDDTDYRTVASSEYLPLMLRLESLRLTEPYAGVTEAEVDVEREVIRNEWRRRSEQKGGYNLPWSYVFEAVYPEGHGYHDYSDHTSIDSIKLADLQKFFDDYYHPDTTTIFVVGDFDPNEAASLIFDNFDPKVLNPDLTADDYFYAPKPGIKKPDQNNPDDWLTGAWDPNSDPANPQPFQFASRMEPRLSESRPPVPPVGTSEVLYRKAPLAEGAEKMVVLGWSLPGGYRSDHFQLLVLGDLATQYVLGAFWEEVDNKKIRASGSGCGTSPDVLNATLVCFIEILDKDMDPLAVREKALNQLAEMWNPENYAGLTLGAQVARLNTTRSQMSSMAELMVSLDWYAAVFGGRAEGIAPFAHYTNNPNYYSSAMEEFLHVDQAAIAKIAYQYLKRDRVATVVLEPLPEDEIDVGSEASSYAGSSGADSAVRATDDLSSVTNEQIADSYLPPDLSKLQDFQLTNGMRVIILPHGVAPVALTTLWIGRDAHEEPEGLFDLAADFTTSVGNDPLPIAGSPSYFVYPGVPGLVDPQYEPYARPLWTSWTPAVDGVRLDMRTPSGNVDGALWLLREELETAVPQIDNKQLWTKAQRDGLEAAWAGRSWHIAKARAEHLYPNSPAGHVRSWEDIEAMDTWGTSDVNGWLRSHFQPANATLLVVGNVDAAEVKKQVETYFGGWKGTGVAPPSKPTAPPMTDAPAKMLVYDEPTRTQSDLDLICRVNSPTPRDIIAVDVLGSLIGNTISSQMRVKEGLAYSPNGTAYVNRDGSGEIYLYSTGVVNAGTGRMVEYYNEALATVEAGNIKPEDVTLHKLRVARESGIMAQSMDQMTSVLLDVVRRGEDWDYATKKGELIAAVTAEDLARLAKGCREHAITTVVGPRSVLTPQFDERGYAYEVVEWRADGDELLWQYDPKAAKKKEKKKQKSDKKAAKEKEKEQKNPEEEGEGTADAG